MPSVWIPDRTYSDYLMAAGGDHDQAIQDIKEAVEELKPEVNEDHG